MYVPGISKEYVDYLKAEMETKKRSYYGDFCNIVGEVFPKIPISEAKKKELSEKLQFIEIETDPAYVYSAAIFIFFIIASLSLIGLLLKFEIFYVLVGFSLGLGLSYYVYIYPSFMSKYYRVKASTELILSILYMVVSLRVTPNLENAVLFAAINLKGPVGRDLKKTMWDLLNSKYNDIDQAVEIFADHWRQENEEFAEAIDVIRTSMLRPESERPHIFQEAISLVLEKNVDRMKNYTVQLKNTIVIITYLGITLPVLTIILFPIMTFFMPTAVKPPMLILLYNVLIPLVVYWLMSATLRQRPLSFGVVNIKDHPNSHPIGTYRIGKKFLLPLWPISILIAAAFIFLGYYITGLTPDVKISAEKMVGSIVMLFGVVGGISFFTFFSQFGNISIKKDIEQIENEFTESLYQFGQILNAGYPIETSIQKLIEKIKNLKISSLFIMAMDNIRMFGFTLKKAIYDKDYGVIKYYPSELINNILLILVESLEKGAADTAIAMISVSNYLKSISRTNIYLKEIMEETTSEMSFMLNFLVPIAAGIVVGMAAVLTSVLVFVAQIFASLTGLNSQIPFSSPSMITKFVDVKSVIPIEWFTIIVGFYMIEVLVSLAIFVATIQHGEDNLERLKLISTSLLEGMIIFVFCVLGIYFFFGGVINLGFQT
jgi:hypothetical protein